MCLTALRCDSMPGWMLLVEGKMRGVCRNPTHDDKAVMNGAPDIERASGVDGGDGNGAEEHVRIAGLDANKYMTMV